MSGGSFDYLFSASNERLIAGEYDEHLECMVDQLADWNYIDAGSETYEFLLILRQMRVRLSALRHRLNPLWQEVEWCVSGDTGKEAVERAIAKYRNGI